MARLVSPKATEPAIVQLTFNQDQGYFACALGNSFRVFRCSPLEETRRVYMERGVAIVQMQYRSNFLALVEPGEVPGTTGRKVLLWDEKRKKIVIEFHLPMPVRNVHLDFEKVVAVLDREVYVYTFDVKPVKQHVLSTAYNPLGTSALCYCSNKSTLAIPGQQTGQLVVIELGQQAKQLCMVQAHQSALGVIAMNSAATLVATASRKGTLIRVFSVQTGHQLYELRRGAEQAQVYCIAFSKDSSRLAMTSERGTVHLFDLINTPSQSTSYLQSNGLVPKYVRSHWSIAKFHVTEGLCMCAFGRSGADSNTVLAIGQDGAFYRYEFGRAGEVIGCARENFLQWGDTSM